MLLWGLGQRPAQADVAAVNGSAYGYSCVISAVGSTCAPRGPTPTVSLAPDASNSPQTAGAASARADSGPATIFSSGRIDVSTQGTLGPAGAVTSSTNIANVNASGQENFTASNLASTCSASETALSGSTAITGGTLDVDNGDTDPTNSIPDHPPVTVTLPARPAPNTTYEGHLHIGNTTDSFRWVFNEQILGADGSVVINAAHEFLLGPIATGELIVGRSSCGVTAADGTTPPPTTIEPGPGPPEPPPPAPAPFAGCPAPTANIVRATAGRDSIRGTPQGDRMFAGAGDDTADGLGGDDCIDLGRGEDRGRGGTGDDLILGGLGTDTMLGSAGDDRLSGQAAGDRLFGGRGSDRLDGQSGDDLIHAGSGADRIAGGLGDDRIAGTSGNDSIKGNFGHDIMSGGDGNDRIDARDGQSDLISCGSGRDTLIADRIDRVARNCERVSRRRP